MRGHREAGDIGAVGRTVIQHAQFRAARTVELHDAAEAIVELRDDRGHPGREVDADHHVVGIGRRSPAQRQRTRVVDPHDGDASLLTGLIVGIASDLTCCRRAGPPCRSQSRSADRPRSDRRRWSRSTAPAPSPMPSRRAGSAPPPGCGRASRHRPRSDPSGSNYWQAGPPNCRSMPSASACRARSWRGRRSTASPA